MSYTGDQLYKVLGPGRRSCHGGSHTWPIGEWAPELENIRACERGYHLVTAAQLPQWVKTNGVVWLAEGAGEHMDESDKSVWGTARITEQVGTLTPELLRWWAVDCAEHILKYADPDWVETLEVVHHITRAYILGGASDEELDAAESAARYAARYAAWYAAWDAARYAAWYAAWDAAWSAAGDAAWTAARTAARDAAWALIGERLEHYLENDYE